VTGQPGRDEALNIIEGATDALGAVREELSRLNAYGRRNRRLIIALAVSLCLDVLLTVAVIVGGVALAGNKATIGEIHQTQVNACQTGNRLRDEQRRLWEHVVAISKPPRGALTPAQARERERTTSAFLAYVRRVLPDLDCQVLYRLSR
jgi:hypothetical protein